VPPAPPVFATPSSVTFNGVGNFPAPPAPTRSVPPKKCKRGLVKKHDRCVKVKAKKKRIRARKANNKWRASR
jgi:hypothetical protein